MFKKYKEALVPIKTQAFMSIPIFDLNGNIYMNLQVTSRLKRKSSMN
jgi:hypothetical protein